ncbi:MAG: hypothetical protein JWM93_107 [Frankiales bacterium]|nr:hypothetical protein [Frankiales bacterium]
MSRQTTMVLHCKPTAFGNKVIYSEGAAAAVANGDCCWALDGAGLLTLYMWAGGGFSIIGQPATLVSGTTYGLGYRIDAISPITVSVWVNGAMTVYTPGGSQGDSGSNATRIGYDTYGDGTTPAEFFVGDIYQVAKLTSAYTDGQMAAITAAAKKNADYQAELALANNSDFAGWWKFAGDLTDSGPNGITGSAVGTITYL